MGTLIIGWTLFLIGWGVLGVSLIAGPFWAPAAGLEKLILGSALDLIGCAAVAFGSHQIAIRILGIFNFLLGAGILALALCGSFAGVAVSGWGTIIVAGLLVIAGVAIYYWSELGGTESSLAKD